jgi:hypothetical protein
VTQYDGHVVEIQGVITMGAGVLYSDRLSTYIQDSSGRGLMLYDPDLTAAYLRDIVRGNRLQVTGTVEEYNGTTEVTDFTYTVVETGVDVDDVVVVNSVAGIQDYASWEGTCVKLTGTVSSISTAGTGANIVVVDDNIELTVRVWQHRHRLQRRVGERQTRSSRRGGRLLRLRPVGARLPGRHSEPRQPHYRHHLDARPSLHRQRRDR